MQFNEYPVFKRCRQPPLTSRNLVTVNIPSVTGPKFKLIS